MPKKIVLNRKNEWMNRLRSYKVLVDGKEIGKIANGKVEEFLVPADNHQIECKVDWCYSNKFDIVAMEGDTIYLQVKSGLRAFWIVYAILIVSFIASFALRNQAGFFSEYHDLIATVGFGIPLLYMGYFLTIGRRQYLKLEKDVTNIFAS